MSDSATEAQINFLRRLASERAIYGPDTNRALTIARVEATIATGLTKQAASDLLNVATNAYAHPATDRPTPAWAFTSLRDLATTKAIYGLHVPPEETLARVEAFIDTNPVYADTSTLLRKAHAAKPHPTGKTGLPLHVIEGIDGLAIREGHYAVLVDDVLRFYRIYRPTTGENKGQIVMRRFAGDNLAALYPHEARTALTLINTDPDGAAYRFADEHTCCWVCGKTLTDSISRLLSVGPNCRGFTNHTGLRTAAADVDRDPTRRHVYRAIREWALARGFRDPANREERITMDGAMTASRVASAWSGIPGMLAFTPEAAVAEVANALNGEVSGPVSAALMDAPADTLLILIESGVLSAPLMEMLASHANNKVKQAAGDYFIRLLAD